MSTSIDAIRTFSLACLALAAGACVVPVEAREEVADVAEADAALLAAPLTCVTIRRGGQGDVEDATVYETAPDYNEGAAPRMGTGNADHSKRALVRFDLGVIPTGALVLWAYMGVAHPWSDTESEIRVHQIVGPWSEATVTWASFAQAYSPDLAGSFFTASGAATRQFRITPLVSGWVSGAIPNHGVLLAEVGQSYHTFASSEHPEIAQRPYLRVCYMLPAPPAPPAP